MRLAFVLLWFWAAISAPVAQEARETRVALVIGNGAYASVGRLDNPARDATAIAQALREAGFQTVQVEADLGHDAMLKALRRFEAAADKADWALVYYAGHGIEVGGVNYLVPVDARIESDRDVEEEAVSLPQVQKRLEGARRLRLVILDACRDNPFAARMRRTRVSARSVGRGLAVPELPQTGSLVAYAAAAGQVALDGEAGNSPYAAALVRNLAVPDVEVNLFFRRVRAGVLRATGDRQEPATYESLPEDRFVFRPAPPPLAASLASPPALPAAPAAIPAVAARPDAAPPAAAPPAQRGVLTPQLGHSDTVRAVAVAPDARRFASGGADGALKLWDAASGRLIRDVGDHRGPVDAVAFSPDGRLLVSASGDGNLRLWDAEGGELLRAHALRGGASTTAFSADGARLAAAGQDGKVRVWETRTGRLVGTCEGHVGPVTALVFSPDGRRLHSGGADKALRTWDAETCRQERAVGDFPAIINSVAVTPDGRRLAVGDEAATLTVLDAADGRILHRADHTTRDGPFSGFAGPTMLDEGPRAVTFSPDGRRLAAAYKEYVLVWDVDSGVIVTFLRGHDRQVKALAYAADGNRLVSGGEDRSLIVWGVPAYAAIRRLLGQPGSDGQVGFVPGTRQLVVRRAGAGTVAYDLGGDRIVARTAGGEGAVERLDLPGRPVGLTPDQGVKLAVTGGDGARVNAALDRALKGGRPMKADLSSDGSRLVTQGGEDSGSGNLRVWNAESGALLRTFKPGDTNVWRLAISPDGRRIATVGDDARTLKLWDAGTVWSRDLVVRVVREPERLVRPGFADGLVGRQTA